MFRYLQLALERISLYLSYFFHKVDGHSLQAPFAFEFYQLATKKAFPEITSIESARRKYQISKETIQYSTFGIPSTLTGSKKGRVASIATYGISQSKSSRLLAGIIQEFQCHTVIELGTSLGINSCYLAAANPSGKVYTFEGHPGICELAKTLFSALEYPNIELIQGNIGETLPKVLNQLIGVDFIYIDATHTSQALEQYLAMMDTKLHSNSIVVIDDIRWNVDMYQGWKNLWEMPKVSHAFDIGNMGFLFFKTGYQKQHYII